MPTMAEKARLAEIARKERSARNWAIATLIVGLSASSAANVASQWDKGPLGWVIAGFFPVALFVTSGLLERIGAIRHKWLAVVVMSVSAGVAAYVSYWDIAHLVLHVLHDPHTAYLTPFAVDAPMLMASLVLSGLRKPTPQNRTSTAEPAKVAKAAAPTKRTTATKSTKTVTKPITVTA